MNGILHVISGDLWAGAEVQVFHTVVALHKRKIDVRVLLFNDSQLARKLNVAGISIRIFNERQNQILHVLKTLAYIRRNAPAIVHVHGYKEHILAHLGTLWLRRPTQILRTFHGLHELPRGLPFIRQAKSYLLSRVEQAMLAECTIIAVTRQLKLRLKDRFPNSMVEFIYNAVPYLKIGPASILSMRQKYGIGNGVFWIGCLARLEPVKNIPMLIRSATILRQAIPRFRISIFGIGSRKESLQRQIMENELDKFVFLEGFEPEGQVLHASLDIFALCSHREGMPMGIVDSCMLGVPIVATRVGGMDEALIHEESALLVESDNHVQLAEQIIRLYREPHLRARIVRGAHDIYQNHFAIDKSAQRLAQLYARIGAN